MSERGVIHLYLDLLGFGNGNGFENGDLKKKRNIIVENHKKFSIFINFTVVAMRLHRCVLLEFLSGFFRDIVRPQLN